MPQHGSGTSQEKQICKVGRDLQYNLLIMYLNPANKIISFLNQQFRDAILVLQACANVCRCTAAQATTGGFASTVGQHLQKVSREIGCTTSRAIERLSIARHVLMPCAHAQMAIDSRHAPDIPVDIIGWGYVDIPRPCCDHCSVILGECGPCTCYHA